MDFDDQMRRYFGTADLSAIEPGALAAGIEHIRVDFGLEQDRDPRFALWTIMYLFGAAPDLDVAFTDPVERDAARRFIELAEEQS